MKLFLWVFIFLILTACENHQSPSVGNSEKPDSIISRDQMIGILSDVHLTEAALAYLKTSGKQMKGLSNDYYKAVFSKYKISRKRFTSSFDYYKRDQEGLIKMYDEVIKKLEAKKSSGKPIQ
jgi:Domain of unknown function (DUF4296)